MLRRTLIALVVCGPAGLCATPAGVAEPSSGCAVPPQPPQTFEVAGQERRAIVVVPDYQADRRTL